MVDGLLKETTCNAKRRIDNAVARKAADSRIFSAAAESVSVVVANVSVVVAAAKDAVVADDDDKRSHQLG